MFKVKYMYVDSVMILVTLDLNLIVSLFQHKCEVSETVSTTTLVYLKLHVHVGHQFYALLKVCLDRDDIVPCNPNPRAILAKNLPESTKI